MDIYTLKTRFTGVLLQPESPPSVEAAWVYFKQFLHENPDDEDCEELGFSAAIPTIHTGIDSYRDEGLFQIYFGRLIDAKKGCPWRTAEINFYFRFKMTPILQALPEVKEAWDPETAYCISDGLEKIHSKRDRLIARVDERLYLWNAIRELPLVTRDIQFYIT